MTRAISMNPQFRLIPMAHSMTNPPPSPPPDTTQWYSGALRVEFDRFYNRAMELALGCARRMLVNEDDAQDVAAWVCYELLDGFRSGRLKADDDTALKRWIARAVPLRRADFIKAQRRQLAKLDLLAEAGVGEADPKTITTDPGMPRLELRDAAVRAVRQMTPKQQRVVQMVREGFTPAQVADDLGITYQSACNTTSRVTGLLREALGPYYEKAYGRRLEWYGKNHSKRKQGGAS